MDFARVKKYELIKSIGLECPTLRTELHALLSRRRATSQLSVSYPSGIRRSSALTTSLELRLTPRFAGKLGEETNLDAIREARMETPRDPEYVAGGTEGNLPLIR